MRNCIFIFFFTSVNKYVSHVRDPKHRSWWNREGCLWKRVKVSSSATKQVWVTNILKHKRVQWKICNPLTFQNPR